MNTRTIARPTTLRRVTTRAATTLALSAAVAGLTGGVASAASVQTSAPVAVVDTTADRDTDPQAEGTVDALSSRRVAVTNLTDYTLTLRSVEGDQWFEGRPIVGDSIAPLGDHGFEMQQQWLKDNNETATYDVVGPDGSTHGTIVLHMWLSTGPFGAPSQVNTCQSVTMTNGDTLECASDRYGFTITHPQGSVRTLDGSRPNAVAIDMLQKFCAAGQGTCSFTPESETRTWGRTKQIGSRLVNASDLQQSKSVQVSEAESASDTLGGSVTLKIPVPVVEVSIQVNYSHTWTKTHTFADTTTVNTPAWSYGWVESSAPVIRHTGDFTLTAHGTTWHITDVSIDSPDPTRQLDMITRTRTMTAEEKADLSPGAKGLWSPEPMVVTSAGTAGQ